MAARGETQTAAQELARELRRLRRASGLTLTALARRTSYSKSSWERYLNGKTTPPVRAVVAFAQAVDTSPEPLLALRGLTERAVGEDHRGTALAATGPVPSAPLPPPPEAGGVPRPPGPAGPRPVLPPPRVGPWTEPSDAVSARGVRHGGASHLLRARVGRLPTVAAVALLGFLAGLLVDWFPQHGGAAASEATVWRGASRPVIGAVGCTGFECKGQDPQRLGCHIGVWSAAVAREGDLYVELRYSPSCRAAWSRVTGGSVGDVARVEEVRGTVQERAIRYDHDTYSPMVEAPYPAAARACVRLVDGREICTPRGGASPLPEAPTNEAHKD